ncbi:MAG: 30S ribosomal protein S16 [Bacteroidetes bacterium]|nr:MAG: 30S ribosomal protein S16 [Bacteroidota bacterium]
MAVKIRLQRFGRKKRAYYHIVVADSRAPRDGKFIARLGNYNPNVNPATIELNVDSAVKWLENGAQPTDTARAILSYKGVLYKHHLNRGVKKGALTQEQADAKFAAWLEEKANRINSKIGGLSDAKAADTKARLEAEAKVNAERAARIAAKNSPVAEEVAEEAAEEATEEVAEDVVEAPVAEEAAAEETPAEAPAEEEEKSAE